LSPDEVLKLEPEEGLDKVTEAIKTCNHYKKVYFTKKDNISTYFKNPDIPSVPWGFGPDLIFSRLDNFVGRLSTIEVCMLAAGAVGMISSWLVEIKQGFVV